MRATSRDTSCLWTEACSRSNDPPMTIFSPCPGSRTLKNEMANQDNFRVGVDIGGTFTDLIVVNDATGEFAVGKTLTTPHDPSQAIKTILQETLQDANIAIPSVSQLIHGTTLVTNAIIERKGA